MVKNYITIALRLLVRHKAFSFINIVGLSTSIACCILITLYVYDEFNYEKGFREGDKVFRINSTFVNDGITQQSAFTAPAIAFGLQQNLPGIEQATRVVKFLGVEQHIVRHRDNIFFEKRAYLVDSTFFEVFPFPFKEGDIRTALENRSSAVISEALSKKIFGDDSALDEMLIINSGQSVDTFHITGVVATSKYPSHLDADLYLTMNSNGLGSWVLDQTSWANNNLVASYLKLQDPHSYSTLEAKFADQVDLHAGEELRASGRKKSLHLQRLSDIRLHSDFDTGFANEGGQTSITYIYIIVSIGSLILLLASVNFMNLATARAAQRSSEIGIRKSMGAFRHNLIGQFLGESLVIVFIAVLLSFLLVWLALPLFNEIMQKALKLNLETLPFIAVAAMIIGLITAFIAGAYPAFFLSALRTAQVLKGKSFAHGGSDLIRKGLVVFQFVITITLLSSIILIQQQLSFIQSKSLGFDSKDVLMVPLRTSTASQAYPTLKSEFERINGVEVVSGTNSLPSTPLFSDWPLYKEGATNAQSLRHEMISVDANYINALNLTLLAGRDFITEQDNIAGDTINPWTVIVNEASLKALDIDVKDAIGSLLYFEPQQGVRYRYAIIGVVKDFHQFSLHKEITPITMILPPSRNSFPYLAVAVKSTMYHDVVREMKEVWRKRIDDVPFESIVLHDNVQKLYASEARVSTMLSISTGIALIISCLGLYALSIFVAQRRTKEIGIRKVVGASMTSIIGMLSKQYCVLLLIAFFIAAPIGYYMMDRWLENFAYRIELGITVFITAGVLSFAIAWLTISFESFRAARKNPVDTLRVQ